jgi:NifU-like protein involved in Fe-S cluster formation
MTTDAAQYHPLVIDLFRRLPFAGSMAADSAVIFGSAGDRESGTEVHFWLRLAGSRVESASFKVYGCPHTIAAAAWMAQKVRGLPLADVERSTWTEVEHVLAVPAEKRGRLLIVQDALKSAARSVPRNV